MSDSRFGKPFPFPQAQSKRRHAERFLTALGFEFPGHRRNHQIFTPTSHAMPLHPATPLATFPPCPHPPKAWTKTPNANMPWR